MRTGSYRLSERERAIIGLTKLGIGEYDMRGILRYARTLARLAEAKCNADWPCDNGERTVVFCINCEAGMVPSKVIGGSCEECRVSDRVKALLRPYAPQGIGVKFAGDPRGYVVKVWSADGAEVGIA